MTVVRFYRNQFGVLGFESQGHTGYDDYGQDIVCAAISALTQTAVIGLTEVVQVEPTVEIEDGYLKCILPEDLTPDTWDSCQLIMKVLLVGLEGIREQYQDFLRIEEV